MDEIIIALYDIASTRSLKIYIRRGYLIFVVGLTYHVSPIGVWIPHVLYKSHAACNKGRR